MQLPFPRIRPIVACLLLAAALLPALYARDALAQETVPAVIDCSWAPATSAMGAARADDEDNNGEAEHSFVGSVAALGPLFGRPNGAI